MSDLASVFEQLKIPDTEITRAAYGFTVESTAEYVLNHSVRSYVFARAQAEHKGLKPGTDYDDELVFLSCVLHDLGLGDRGNGDQRFEVDGADTAVAFLREHDVDDRRLAIVWDAIALHTSPGIADRKGPEVALTHLGIGTDIIGLDRDKLPAGLADQVHALLPRADLGFALTDAILEQAKEKPQKAFPTTFAGELLRRHLPYGAFPTWHDLVSAAGWGDQPVNTTTHPRPQSPEEVSTLFGQYLGAGDLEGLLSLYEPSAVLVPAPGDHRVGIDAIREALKGLISSGARITLQERGIRQVGDIALISNTGTISGSSPDAAAFSPATTEVLRRQPDGSWAYVIDDPFFGSNP